MITSEASTVQLLQSQQGHVVRGQAWDAVLGGRAEVDPVEAAATDVRNGLVVVGFGVPGVAAVLLLSQLLPHIADTRGQTHLGHLRWSPGQQLLKRYTVITRVGKIYNQKSTPLLPTFTHRIVSSHP